MTRRDPRVMGALMEAVMLWLGAVVFAMGATVPASDPCAGGEVLFQCPVKGGKEIKVCGAGKTAGDAWITYTYGKPGAAELTFPESREFSPARFGHEERTFAQSMGDVMSFWNGEIRYEVTEMMGAGGPNGETNNFAGVYVFKGESVLATVACTTPATSNWARIKEILAIEIISP